jgi:hypothetical protein
MQQETTFGTALRRAGIDTRSARLYSEAVRIMREAGGKPDKALSRFKDDVLSEPGLLDALALGYLRDIAQDMKGLTGGAIEQLPKGQRWNAPTRQTNEREEGQRNVAEKANASVPSSRSPVAGEGAESLLSKDQMRSAPSSAQDRARTGQTSFAVTATGSMPPAREPSRSQLDGIIAARKSAAIRVLTVFDSYKVRDGRSIGEVTFGEVGAMRAANMREAFLFGLIRNHVGYAETSASIRDLVNAETLERFVQKAAEMSDAA